MRSGIGLAALAGGLGMMGGCATTETSKEQIAPTQDRLSYKILPPSQGCLVGFYKDQKSKYQMGTSISTPIDHYRSALGRNPAILAFWSFLSLGFPAIEAMTMKENGVVPYINIMPGHERWTQSFSPGYIAQGWGDWYIKELAKEAVKYGKQHGGFFFTTMVEFNAAWWYWSQKPDTTAAIRRIWQIFEDQGANQYATWVWEAFCPARYSKYVTDPEPYYPGDKYVDWIGINVFANLKNPYISQSTRFSELMSKTYEQMQSHHPQKPIMVSEFGRTPGETQPSWLIDAYKTMKNDFPPLKAAIYYDNITNVFTGQDHTLDSKSLNTLKEVFKDPYWIMAK